MPLLTSFPRIYTLRQRDAKLAPVKSYLEVTSSIGAWIGDLETGSRMRVSVDEREELSHGLKTMKEAYAGDLSDDEDEGWDD